MAASLKNRTFTTVGDKNDDVLGSGYVHGAIETWKVKGKTSNGGKWDWKGKVKHSQQGSVLKGNLDDEVKFQFPWDRYHFWFGSKSGKGARDLKMHVDFGNVHVGGKDYNLFANMKTQSNFQTFNTRVGWNHFGEKFTTSSRLNSVSDGDKNDVTLTNRVHFKQNELFFGLVTAMGLTGQVKCNKLEAMLGWEKDNNNVYLEYNANCCKKVAPGKVTLTSTHSKDNNTFGLELSNDFQKSQNSWGAAMALQTSCKSHGVTTKGKVNQNLDVELSYKKKVSDKLSVTASGKLSLLKEKAGVDFSKYVPIPFGLEFEVNI